MSRDLVAALNNLIVQHNLTGVRPTVGTDGVDISGWKTDGAYSTPRAAIYLDGTAAANVSAPTGGTAGPELWGYTANDTKWRLVGYLNNGNAIAIVGAAEGFAQSVDIVGIFDRLFVSATAGAGTVAAKFVPLDSYT